MIFACLDGTPHLGEWSHSRNRLEQREAPGRSEGKERKKKEKKLTRCGNWRTERNLVRPEAGRPLGGCSQQSLENPVPGPSLLLSLCWRAHTPAPPTPKDEIWMRRCPMFLQMEKQRLGRQRLVHEKAGAPGALLKLSMPPQPSPDRDSIASA